VPAFETADGQYLTESNAIAYYGKHDSKLCSTRVKSPNATLRDSELPFCHITIFLKL